MQSQLTEKHTVKLQATLDVRSADEGGFFNPNRIAIDRWLRDLLKTGPKASAEVYRRGRSAKFSERELRNARQRIGAWISRCGYPCRTAWFLRGHGKGAGRGLGKK